MKQQTTVKMGQLPPSWGDGNAKSITFCVTEDCNLACKYCYMTGKNNKHKMTYEVAKQAVDYVLSHRESFPEEGVIWEFIGGEPFLEIELIDRLSDYIKQQMFLLNHPWFDCYRFNFSSNGILYDTPAVQNYIRKNRAHLSVGISVDGNKIKHDLQRVRPDGTGSYDDVVRNVPLWLEQFSDALTKSTFAHDDLPYLKDSIINLWNLGIKTVAANVVFEDVWEDGDDLIFENQLKELADYVLEHSLWKDYSVRFFDPNIGHPLTPDLIDRNYCGSGKMLAIDTEGNLFPCVRFYGMSLNHKKGLVIGDIYRGIDQDKLRPFQVLSLKNQSPAECIECEVASGCAWCTGGNYDMAETDTIYQRTTYICKMHKANVRACRYFWDKFTKVTGLPSEWELQQKRIQMNLAGSPEVSFLQFITRDTVVPYCSYRNWNGGNQVMEKEVFEQGLHFAEDNGLTPVLLGVPDFSWDNSGKEHYLLVGGDIKAIPPDAMVIYDIATLQQANVSGIRSNGNCIILVNPSQLDGLAGWVQLLAQNHFRINICLEEINKWEESDLKIYQKQLCYMAELVINAYRDGRPLEINALTDILNVSSMTGCDAGLTSYALAPNGKIYLCPAFYFDNPENYIGSLNEGIHIQNRYLFELEKAPVCSGCDAYHCTRCKFWSKKMTGEYHVPSRMQCMISHIERNQARALQTALKKENLGRPGRTIPEVDYLDPLEKVANQ